MKIFIIIMIPTRFGIIQRVLGKVSFSSSPLKLKLIRLIIKKLEAQNGKIPFLVKIILFFSST